MHKTAQIFTEDPKFMESWQRISSVGVPVDILHMPIALELEKGRAFDPGVPYQKRQFDSLKALSTLPMRFHDLYDEMKTLPADRIAALAISPQNQHPTRIGLDLYAEAVAKYVMERRP